MEDISVEQIIKVNPPKMALFYKIGLGILTLVSVFLIRYLVGFGVILTACFGLFLILLWRYYDAEYEYELVDGELSIDRIMAQRRLNTESIRSLRPPIILPIREMRAAMYYTFRPITRW